MMKLSLTRDLVTSLPAAARRRHRRLAVRTAACVVAAACCSTATPAWADDTLLFDPQMLGTAGSDGSGPWDTSTAIWATGFDVTYPNVQSDETNPVFGFNTGSGAYTVTLGTNIIASNVTVNSGGAGSSYTFNAAGFTLSATADGTDDGMDVNGGNLTLANGTFQIGGPAFNTSGAVSINTGGILNVTSTATVSCDIIDGDGSAGSTVRFNGGTFRPTANLNDSNGGIVQTLGVTNFYVGAGGITIDMSTVATGADGVSILANNMQHDPTVTGTDGGLKHVNGGVLYLGDNDTTPGDNSFDPLFTYNGPTTTAGGIMVLDSGANLTTTGPFPNTQFVVGTATAGGQLDVVLNNGLIGVNGTTPVTLNPRSYLVTFDQTVVRVANVNSTGGTLYSFAGTNSSTGQFTFTGGSEYHVMNTSTATTTTPTVSTDQVSFLSFDPGSDIRVDAAASLTVRSSIINDGTTAGQVTVNGTGVVNLYGNNTYSGATSVNGGTVTLSSTFVNGSNGVRVFTPGRSPRAGRSPSRPARRSPTRGRSPAPRPSP